MRGAKPCWQCQHFAGWLVRAYTSHPGRFAMSVCARQKLATVPEPQFGCVYWSREPGSDDEPGCVDPAGEKHLPGVLSSEVAYQNRADP